MSLLPEIVAIHSPGDHQRELDLFVSAGISHFAGHFPGMPILPGVVQVDWAARWGKEFFNIPGDFVALENLKFKTMVFPDTRISLVLTWNPEKSQLGFSYTVVNGQGERQVVSAGRFSFSGSQA